MSGSGFVNEIPLSLFFVGTCLLVLAFWEAGYQFGHRWRTKGITENEGLVSTMVSIIVGLVAFLLAFSFNMASGRFQERRDVLIADVNAIGTTYLRADTIAEPERSKIKELLREYVDNRINAGSVDEMKARLAKANEIQNSLWQQTVAVADKDRSDIAALFVTTMNEMIDIHTKRLTIVTEHHIPDSIWAALLGLTCLGIAAMGYQNGLLEHGRSPGILIVTLMFAIVIFMIADLDRPGQGTITVDQQAMSDLRKSM